MSQLLLLLFSMLLYCYCRYIFSVHFEPECVHIVPKWIRTDPVDKSVLERNSVETVVCISVLHIKNYQNRIALFECNRWLGTKRCCFWIFAFVLFERSNREKSFHSVCPYTFELSFRCVSFCLPLYGRARQLNFFEKKK